MKTVKQKVPGFVSLGKIKLLFRDIFPQLFPVRIMLIAVFNLVMISNYSFIEVGLSLIYYN